MTKEELSVSQYGRYIKLFIALVSGYMLPYLFGHKELSASMATSAWLSLALGPSISNSRAYFVQRFMTNLVPILGGTIIFIITRHGFITMMIVTLFMFVLMSKFPNRFRLTSLGVSLTLITGIGGNFTAGGERLISVWLGMAVGFFIECYILPPDQGFKMKKMLTDMEKKIIKIYYGLLHDRTLTSLKGFKIDELTEGLKKIEAQMAGFNKDFSIKWAKHLRKYEKDIDFFKYSIELLDVSVRFLQKVCLFENDLTELSEEEKKYLFVNISEVVKKHEKLLLSFYETTENTEYEEEHFLEQNMDILISYLAEYQDTVRKISKEMYKAE